MKKILITGGSGLLGQHLNISLSNKSKILTTYRSNPGNCNNFSNRKIDIRTPNDLENLFESFHPEIVIHTAALTNPIPDEDQTARDYFETNVKATQNIAGLCGRNNIKLVYISTDLVYAGYRGSFLKEDSKLIPATLYAETKLVGESKVKEATDNFLILRAALLYGFGLNHSRCHFQDMFEALKFGKQVKLFCDQFRTPISLTDTARLISELSLMDIVGETINLGGTERVSRYEIGEMLCSIAGFDKNLLLKIKMDDIPNFPIVEDVSLNIDKLRSFGLKLRSIEDNIRELVADRQ